MPRSPSLRRSMRARVRSRNFGSSPASRSRRPAVSSECRWQPWSATGRRHARGCSRRSQASAPMTPERWRRITDVFHLARARDDAARIAVLGECCADDAVLRAEVEDLLAADRAAGEFGVAPLVPVDAVRLEAGSRLGQYEIVAFLAAGGMGEVYRARDIRLGRDVALKVLPDLLAHDAERLTRFKREAVVLAALNHPHVATLYGIEESHGRSALIMELVEGPTLAARLDEGRLIWSMHLRWRARLPTPWPPLTIAASFTGISNRPTSN